MSTPWRDIPLVDTRESVAPWRNIPLQDITQSTLRKGSIEFDDEVRTAEMSRLLLATTESAVPMSTAVAPPKGMVQRILDGAGQQDMPSQPISRAGMGLGGVEETLGQPPTPKQTLESAIPEETEPRFKTFFRETITQPLSTLVEGYYAGSAGIFDMLDQLARTLERKTGIDRGGLFEDLARFYTERADEWTERGIPPEQGFVSELARSLYLGTGQLAIDLPFLYALGQWGLPIWGGLHGAAGAEREGENVLAGTAKGAAKGALLHGALKASRYLPKPEGVAAGGAIFGGMAAAEGGEMPEIVASTLLGVGLTLPGRGMPRKQAAENIRTGLGLERAAELKLTKGEINALRKVYNQPEYAKQTDVDFIKSLTREQTTELFRNEKIPVPVRSKIRAVWNRATGKPVHEGVEVLGKPEEIYIEKAPRGLPPGQREGVEYPVEYVGKEAPLPAGPVPPIGGAPLKGTVEYPVETKAPAEVKPKPPLKKQPAVNLGTVAKGFPAQEISVSRITTNEQLFQPREKISPEMVQRIAEGFDPALWDPPVLWKDPSSGDLVVISGHTRFAGLQQAGFEKGTFKVLPEGTTIEEAQSLAESGNLARVEQNDWENAGVVRRRVDKGEPLAQIRKDLPGLGSQEKVTNLLRISHLNTKGPFRENYEVMGFPRIKSFSYFAGQMRKQFSWLTDQHEQDIFNYLYRDGAAGHIDSAVPKEVILNNIEVLAEKRPEHLDLSRNLQTGLAVRGDTAAASAELKEKRRDLKRLVELLTSNELTNEGRRQIKVETSLVEGEIFQLEKALDIIQKTQASLFEGRGETPKPVINMFTGEMEKPLTDAERNALSEQTEIRRLYQREQEFIRKRVAAGEMPETEAVAKRAKARSRYTRKLERLGQRTLFGGGESDVQQAKLFEGREAGARHVRTFGTGGLHDMTLVEGMAQKKPIKASRIIRKLEHNLGVRIMGKATHPKGKRSGWYQARDRLIRVFTANDLTTATHETGHYVERLIWGEGENMDVTGRTHFRPFRKELADLDYDQGPNGRRSWEGFAEYMSHYLTGDVAQLAPEFHRHFTEEVLPGHPKIKSALDKARVDIQQYREQGAEARVLSQIDLGDRKIEAVKEFMDDPGAQTSKAIMKLRQWFVDDLAPLEARMKRSGIKREELRPTEDPIEVARAVKEKAPGIAKQFVLEGTFDLGLNKTGPGLVEIIKPVRKNMRQFLAYAYSRRAIDLYTNQERVQRAYERGEKPPQINPGISYEDAQHVVEKYDNPVFRKASDQLTRWSDALLQYLVDAGGLSPEAASAMRALNPVYLPLKRSFQGEVIGTSAVGAGRGYADQGQPVKRIKGSGREIQDPVESMVQYASGIISVANKIRVAKALVGLIDKHPGLGSMIVEVPPPKRAVRVNTDDVIQGLADMGFDFGDAPEGPVLDEFMTLFQSSPRYTGKDRVVAIWKGGERHFYEIVDEDLYKIMKGLDPHVFTPFFELILAKPTRMLRLGATALNPGFSLIRNLMRDVMMFAVTSEYAKFGPFSGLKGTGTDILDSVGIIDAPAAKKFKRGGGELTSWIGQDRRVTRKIDKKITKNATYYYVTHPIEAVRILFQVPEIGTRIAEYGPALEEGERLYGEGTEDAAIYAMNKAQDVTVNFTRKGTIGRILNQMIPFWNASVQGASKMYRTFRDRPIKGLYRFLIWIGSISTTLWLLNKDKKAYQELSSWERANYWHIISDDEKVIIKIPKPHEIGVVATAIEAYLDEKHANDDRLMKDVLLAAAERTAPSLAPAVISPLIDVWRNEDFSGRPIVREADEAKLPADQYNEDTYALFKFIGTKTGVSPAKMQHVVNAYSGGLVGRVARTVENAVTILAEDDTDLTRADIPVIGTLFKRTIGKPGRTIERFYDELTSLRKKRASKKLEGPAVARLRVLERKATAMSRRWKKLREAKKQAEIEAIYLEMVKVLAPVYSEKTGDQD